MAFVTDGKAGANLGSTTTDQKHVLGTRVNGSADSVWVYVQADGAIAAYDTVNITAAYQCAKATIANSMAGQQIGFAQNAFADNDYGWVAIAGNPLTVLVSATSTLNVAIYVGTGTGHISTTAGSATLAGVALQTASTTAAVSAFTAVVSWPRLRLDGLS